PPAQKRQLGLQVPQGQEVEDPPHVLDLADLTFDPCFKDLFFGAEMLVERATPTGEPGVLLDVADGRAPRASLREERHGGGDEPVSGCFSHRMMTIVSLR